MTVLCLCSGCTLPGSGSQDIVIQAVTPTPTVTIPPPDSVDYAAATPAPTNSPTPATGIVQSPSVQEIIVSTPTPVRTTAPIATPTVDTRYYPLLDDTRTYNDTTRMFDLTVTNVPYILSFSFDPGYVHREYVAKDYTAGASLSYEVFNAATGKYETISETMPKYEVAAVNRINPDAWFTIDLIRIYKDPTEYQAAVAAAGGETSLGLQNRLYEDNGILVLQEGFANKYSSEVEKEIQIRERGYYRLIVNGNAIDTTILILSPV